MNLLKTICVLSLLAAAFTGCDQIDEDLEACYGEAVIRFDYPYNGQLTYFSDRIHSVKVGIYRVDDGVKVEDRYIPQDSLTAFQGMRVNLPVGNYRAVFWGDANEHTTIDWIRQLTYNPELFDIKEDDEEVHTDDDLDYSSLEFEVKRNRGVNEVDTAHFEPAHITFNISVMMPVDLSADYIPALSINHLNTEVYDFNMQESSTDDRQYTFYPIHTLAPGREEEDTPHGQGGYVIQDVGGEPVYVLETITRTHRLANDNPVVIELFKNSAEIGGTPIRQLKLSDYISSNSLYITPKKECTFDITFVISKTANVSVYPLPWEKVGVDPIFPDTGGGTKAYK
jgi:hypothetical protein